MPKSSAVSFFSVKEIAYLSLMIAAATVGRIFFQFLPNIQPMTAIFLILTLKLGVIRGIIVCILSVITTNLYLGMGVWTISQIVSYTVVICFVGVLAQFAWYRRFFALQIVVSVFSGFLYGFIISLISMKMFGFTNFWVYYFQGLSFDTLHALGNGAFYFILTPIFVKLLRKMDIKS
ncbi:hypothetical protein SAMN02745116_01117 [Pilibacter termitis]|uniref:Energy-coupling factor transport system substrate-specific component n=1 Tax=Pilibacter termitis TaxID=263852 RepID=A0A1T4MJA2_9ENTE|nr:ECF transporter S component [Pilibacter termitis]SJZ67023.1 hypothetical protein SAMN02745116_01117 [Pilibacter termitis]